MKYLIQVFLALYLLLNLSCGVKGNPLPPLEPPSIGRGKPSLAKPAEQRRSLNKNKDWEAEDNNDEDNDN